MTSDFSNVYDDAARAEAYDQLELPGTYALAYRDLPELLAQHARGRRALDFGCGTGRSTRFLRALGFDVVGVDSAMPMLERARARDPGGDYRLVGDGDLRELSGMAFDVILSAFTFDNVPTHERKLILFGALRELLAPDGRIVNLVSSPAIYLHEWASFSTRDFPENRLARNGDKVRIVMLDVGDRRPVEDVLWTPEGHREVYARAGLSVLDLREPLARPGEGGPWASETTVSPWTIWVLGRSHRSTQRE